MKQISGLSGLLFLILFSSCKTTQVTTKDDGKIEVTFLQVNDVYEIAPVNGGAKGGMARIATLKKQYLKTNSNTFLVMSGDFLSPSIYSTLSYKGKRVRGAQMVEAMNSAGVDYVCFGNHEFDITENELQERLNESNFTWISSNAFHKVAGGVKPFARTGSNTSPLPETFIKTIKDADGTTAKIGFIGLVLPANAAEYVAYTDVLTAAKEAYNKLKDSVDAVVAITHEDSSFTRLPNSTSDKILAAELPGLAAILGGHEHNGTLIKIGNVYISKAEFNAQTAMVVKININTKTKQHNTTKPEVVNINNSIPLDSATNAVVNKWGSIVSKSYADIGFKTDEVIVTKGEPLEIREIVIDRAESNFTRIVTGAMAAACPQADVVIFNAGSARLDDILVPPVTQYDIIRSMPYGGGLREADMKGSLLIQVLDSAKKNINKGGWLHYQPLVFDASTGKYTLKGAAIDPLKVYRVAVTDFLFTGKEISLGFLNERNPLIVKVYPEETSLGSLKSDIRLAIINYIKSRK